jgi:RNA polymerase sigma-70 factor (ECF subfamily)
MKRGVILHDEELIQKLLNGDQNAFSHLIDKYNRLLWVIVGGILGGIGTAQDIEECISDVYVQVWKHPRAFNKQKGSLKTFLCVIAKSRALNVYKKLVKMNIADLNGIIRAEDDDLLDYILNKEMIQVLYTAIESLAEPDKEIVIRRYFLEEKPARIAENISLPVKEVENRLYRSKLKLRRRLEEKEVLDYGQKKLSFRTF